MEVVDVVGFRDFVALGGVEDWEGGTGVGDHGARATEVVHADREDLRVLLLDPRVITLQLDELPEAYPSEEASIKDQDDVLVAAEVGQGDVRDPVRDREVEVGCGSATFRRIGATAGNGDDADDEGGDDGN